AVQELIQALGKGARARLRLDGVAQRHLLEREDHAVACALFDAHGAGGYLSELARTQQAAKLCAVQSFCPTLMRLPFVCALPLNISLVAEAAGEEAQKLAPAT